MPKDELRDLTHQIEAYCKERRIATFYGTVEERDRPQVLWDREDSGDFQCYLGALHNSTARILTISTAVNELEEELETSPLATWSPEEQKAYSEAVRVLHPLKGHLAYFTLTFFEAGVAYQYYKSAPWIEHYVTLLSFLDTEDQAKGEEVKEETLSLQQIERLARGVLVSPEYQAAPNRLERRSIAATQLQDLGVEDRSTIHQIFTTVEALYEQEVQPALERVLKTQIQQLKQQGLKKVEVRSRLGLSERALNKHWY